MGLFLPRFNAPVTLSPLVVQGSKQKLVQWILSNIQWDGRGTYYEPFCGSGIVGINIRARKAVFGDNNVHIIRFFNDIKDGTLNLKYLVQFLSNAKKNMHREWKDKSLPDDEKFYYKTRAEFNEHPDSIRFLYLNVACYKNLMRFNSKGKFNSPFLYDAGRYLTNERDITGKYIEILVSRIMHIKKLVTPRPGGNREYTFAVTDFKDLLSRAEEGDLVYADPPYIGRDVNYFEKFSMAENDFLVEWTRSTASGFAISNWYSDAKVGINPHLAGYHRNVIKTRDHQYSIENCQTMKTSDKSVKECLVISKKNDVTATYGLMKFLSTIT